MITIFIEGTSAESAGNLREAFSTLLRKANTNQRFRIQMGDDKGKTIHKFNQFQPDKNDKKAVMTDLDGDESERAASVLKISERDRAHYFLMVQEMEAWFFSQPEVLEKYYGKTFKFGKFRGKDPQRIPNPSDELASLTKKTQKGEYHKVRHACDLIPKLSLTQLQKDFKDVADLVKLLV